MTAITGIVVHDVRAPTSRTLSGSDAVHRDPDYSAAYAVLQSDRDGLEGHGFSFTIGRGNEIVCAAIGALAPLVVGADLDAITADFAGFHRRLTNESQLRWLGPDKGVIHLAAAALVNAIWDLWAKREGKPVWKLVADLSPERLLACVDLRYLSEALTREEALGLLRARAGTKAKREAELRREGYPAYLTSAGWLGYSDAKVRELTRAALDAGWTRFKAKVGIDVDSDVRRLAFLREQIGERCQLMADANQVWGVPEAIAWIRRFQPFRLRWIEEPTSPDDVLGHAAIRRGVTPIGVATGEHCANKVLFKQLMQAGALDYCQVDACRLAGLNEVLAVLLLAAKFGVPVCPHAGGIGLCEYVQHVSAIDYIAVSGSLDDRSTEYAEHLHEHFVDPVRVEGGRYRLPEAPGYSAQMKPESLAALAYPGGSEWRR
jgi:L-fuconate dehydratase